MCGQPGRRTTTYLAPAPSNAFSACRSVLQDLSTATAATPEPLTDLADVIGASTAYVDRPTVQAHLERPLSDR